MITALIHVVGSRSVKLTRQMARLICLWSCIKKRISRGIGAIGVRAGNLNIERCGCSSMVESWLAESDVRVRVPPPAPLTVREVYSLRTWELLVSLAFIVLVVPAVMVLLALWAITIPSEGYIPMGVGLFGIWWALRKKIDTLRRY